MVRWVEKQEFLLIVVLKLEVDTSIESVTMLAVKIGEDLR